MILRRRILRLLLPESELQRMKLRGWLARANAEVEDLNRALRKNGFHNPEMMKKFRRD